MKRSAVVPWVVAAILAATWCGAWWGFLAAEMPGGGPRGAVLFSILLLPDAAVQSWVYGDAAYAGVLDRGPILLIAAALIALAHGIGLACVPVRVRWLGIERQVFAGVAGMHVVSTLCLASAWTFGLRGGIWTWWPIAAAAAVAGWRWLRRTRPGADEPPRSPPSAWWKAPAVPALVAAVALLLWMLLAATSAPTDFDVREYHLQTPKEWFQSGGLEFLPHNVYSNMPLSAEAPALIAMTMWPGELAWWHGALAGKVWMAWYSVLAAAGLWSAARRWFGPEAGAWSVCLFAASPWMFHVSTSGLNEGVLAANLLLALYAARLAGDESAESEWNEAGPHEARSNGARSNGAGSNGAARMLGLSGWLTGAAAACKYTAIPLLAAPLAVWVALQARRGGLRGGLLWLLLAVLGGGGWYAKNAVQTGNPVFPLATSWLGGRSWTAEQQQRWDRVHRPPASAARGPFAPGRFYEAAASSGWRHAWASPATAPLLVAAVLAFWPGGVGAAGQRPPPTLVAGRWWLGWFCWMAAVWFVGTHRLDRFLAPALPLVWLAGSAAITAWSAPAIRWGQRVLVAASLSVGAAWILSPIMSTGVLASLAVQREDPEGFRLHPAWVYLNRSVPPGGSSLLVGEAQVFDFEHPVLYATCFDESPLEEMLRRHPDPEGLWRELTDRGVALVLVRWREIARYRSPGNYGFDDWIQPEVMRRLEESGVLIPAAVPGVAPSDAAVWRVAPTPPSRQG